MITNVNIETGIVVDNATSTMDGSRNGAKTYPSAMTIGSKHAQVSTAIVKFGGGTTGGMRPFCCKRVGNPPKQNAVLQQPCCKETA